MYFLRTEECFDSAHFLKGYDGKCSNLHGHRWKVVVEINRENLNEEGPKRGMIIDFTDIKDALKELCDAFDHQFIIETGSLKEKTKEALLEEGFKIIELPMVPTAENFAKYFYDCMKEKEFPVHRVEVYETPNNFAAYEE